MELFINKGQLLRFVKIFTWTVLIRRTTLLAVTNFIIALKDLASTLAVDQLSEFIRCVIVTIRDVSFIHTISYSASILPIEN